jgi:hypothetical protein
MRRCDALDLLPETGHLAESGTTFVGLGDSGLTTV